MIRAVRAGQSALCRAEGRGRIGHSANRRENSCSSSLPSMAAMGEEGVLCFVNWH
jgi:hypothetical protein